MKILTKEEEQEHYKYACHVTSHFKCTANPLPVPL